MQYVPSLIYNKKSPFPKDKMWLLGLRGLADGVNLIMQFYALKVLPLGDVTMMGSVRVSEEHHQKSSTFCTGCFCQLVLLHLPEGTLWNLSNYQHFLGEPFINSSVLHKQKNNNDNQKEM